MYRGSRLAASFLLVLTGLAVSAIALFVLPQTAAATGAPWLVVVGIARGRDWGRNLAVFVAEFGGGVAFLGAVALLTGAKPFGASSSTGIGLILWTAAVYALLGIAAGRVPVLSRLTPIERRRVVFGPSFAGMAG